MPCPSSGNSAPLRDPRQKSADNSAFPYIPRLLCLAFTFKVGGQNCLNVLWVKSHVSRGAEKLYFNIWPYLVLFVELAVLRKKSSRLVGNVLMVNDVQCQRPFVRQSVSQRSAPMLGNKGSISL